MPYSISIRRAAMDIDDMALIGPDVKLREVKLDLTKM
jgi:hypothetical protein